jgi:pimeloyl-ACP methyl ester carboxylesterase
MIASVLASRMNAQALIVISAAARFCRSLPEYPLGWKPSALDRMVAAIQSDPGGTINSFYAQCGVIPDLIDQYAKNAASYTKETLCAGLEFLKTDLVCQALKKPSCPSLVLHGSDDRVVPMEAGRQLADKLGVQFAPLPGSHVFFTDKDVQKTMRKVVSDFLGC